MIDNILESTDNLHRNTLLTESDNNDFTDDVQEYDIVMHDAKQILKTLFNCLSVKDEKLPAIILKIFDLLLEK